MDLLETALALHCQNKKTKHNPSFIIILSHCSKCYILPQDSYTCFRAGGGALTPTQGICLLLKTIVILGFHRALF